MRGAAVIVVLALLAAGCGSQRRTPPVATTIAAHAGLHIGVVGPLDVHVQGAVIEHGSLARVAGDRLVVVSADVPAAARLGPVAIEYPSTHFALVGGSALALRLPNVAGLVIRDDQAALLAGVAAGLAAADEGVARPRVAWVGPQDRQLVAAFARGVHDVNAPAQVLRAFRADQRTACKEAALGAILRGAVAIMAAAGRAPTPPSWEPTSRMSWRCASRISSCHRSRQRRQSETRSSAYTTAARTSSSGFPAAR